MFFFSFGERGEKYFCADFEGIFGDSKGAKILQNWIYAKIAMISFRLRQASILIVEISSLSKVMGTRFLFLSFFNRERW